MNDQLLSNNTEKPTNDTKPTKVKLDFLRFFIAIIGFVFIGVLLVLFFLSDTSDEHTIITGTHFLQPDGRLLFSTTGATFERTNYFSSIYIKIDTDRFVAQQSFSVNATFTCQSPTTTAIFSENITQMPIGEAELYTTWFPIYHSMIVEANIEGPLYNSTQVSLFVVKMKEPFAYRTITMNTVIRIATLLILLFYLLFFVVYWRTHLGFLQIFTIVVLVTTFVANLPFNHGTPYLSVTKHAFYLLFKGSLSAVNIVALFGAAMFYYSTENLATALLIAFVYIFAEAICALTTDSYIQANVFDNNGIVWVFFFTSSIISKVSLTILSGHHFIQCAINAQHQRKRTYYIFFFISLLVLITPIIMRAFLMIIQGYQNSGVNFFCDYIVQFIFVVMYTQLCWPTITKSYDPNHVNELMRLGSRDFALERDMSVQFEQPEE